MALPVEFIETLNTWDRSLFLWMNSFHTPASDAFWLFMTGKWAWVLLFAPALYYVFKAYKLKGFYTVIAVLFVFLIADQGSNLAKMYVERPRPCRETDLAALMHYIAPGCSAYGFWSGHSANAFAQITFFMLLGVVPAGNARKIMYPYWVLWAALVAISRVMVGVHYPGDILVGMLYGVFSGALVYAVFHRVRKRFKALS